MKHQGYIRQGILLLTVLLVKQSLMISALPIIENKICQNNVKLLAYIYLLCWTVLFQVGGLQWKGHLEKLCVLASIHVLEYGCVK